MKLRRALASSTMIAVALFVQACSRPMNPQDSCNFVQNSEQQRVSWKGKLPIKLYIHKSFPQEGMDSLKKAIAQYNTTIGGGRELLRIEAQGVDGELNPSRDGFSTIYWFKTWDPNKPTEQARTTIYWSGTEIFEADMRINALNFNYNFSDTTTFSDVDLTSLILHELGHVFGLAHNPATGSTMNAVLDEGQVRRKLGDVDVASLKCEY